MYQPDDPTFLLSMGVITPRASPRIPASPAEPPSPVRRSAGWSTATTFVTTGLVSLLSLGNVLVTSHFLGASGRGEIALAATIATLMSQIATVGLQQASSTAIGRDPKAAPRVTGTVLVLSATTGAVTAMVILVLSVVAPRLLGDVSGGLLALVLVAIPAMTLQSNLLALVTVHYAFSRANRVIIIAPVLNVVVNVVMGRAGVLSVASAVTVWVAGQVLVMLLLLVTLRAQTSIGRPSSRMARDLVSFGAKVHVGGVLNLGNYRLDQWFVGAAVGTRALGVYSVAVAWSESLFLLPTAVQVVQRADLVRASIEEARRQTAEAFRCGLLLMVPFASAMILVAPLLCTGLFGPQFAAATLQLQVLALGAPGVLATKLFANALSAQDRPWWSSRAIGTAFAVTVVLDVLLIPHWAGLGAAVASTAAYTAGGVTSLRLFARVTETPVRGFLPRRTDLTALRSHVHRAIAELR